MNIALKLSYLGTAYHGWQRQNNGMTIQESIETAIAKATGQVVTLSGCGRTDAGVHAEYYIASVKLDCKIPLDRLPHAINAYLAGDIVIHEAILVPDDFDARFSCVSKEYTYRIHNSPTRNPFLNDRAYFYPKHLDEAKMARAASFFVGEHDFSAVRSLGTPVRSPVREIYYLDVTRQGDMIEISACANGFLYNMVRAIAGTLVFCGNGKIAPDEIADILLSKDRERGGPTAPACGLYMTALTYNMEKLDGTSKKR